MKDCIIAVKRTPDGLVAVVSRRHHDFWKALYSDNLIELVEMYSFVEEPQDYLKKTWPKYFEKYSSSWKAVSKVRTWNADLLYHVLRVLLTTVPVFPRKNLRLPLLDLETEQATPKKTAANPRGLRAKKGKEQKSKSLPEIDLRPYLCDPKSVSTILYKLKPYWQDAIDRLRKSKFDVSTLAQTPKFTVEPYLRFHHSGSSNVKRTKLPRNFIQFLLFWLSNLPWRKLKKFLSLYYKLRLERDETLLGAVSRLLAHCEPEQALVWLQIARDLPAGKRYSFLLILLERETWDLDFKKYPPKAIGDLCAMIPYSHLEDRMDDLFWNLNSNVSIQCLVAGYKLAEKYGWDYHLVLAGDCPNYPTKKTENLIQWLKCKSSWLPLGIWKKFGVHKDWGILILRPEWKQYSPETARYFIERFFVWVDDHKRGELKKRKALQFLNNIDNALQNMSKEYHSDFFKHLAEIYETLDNKDTFEKYLKPICELFIRLAQKPIPYSTLYSHTSLTTLIQLTRGNIRQRFINAPNTSFLKLDKACETGNKKDRVSWGLYNLTDQLPEFVVNSFIHFPGKLIKVTERLGSMRFINRHETVKQFARHQLLKVDFQKVSPRQLYRLVERYRQSGMTHPVPKKLQDHFKEKIKLNETRIQGYHEKSKNNFLSFVLDILNQHVLDTMSRFYPSAKEKDNWEHTLQFLNWVDTNRRGLKNFLKAYFGGNNHYVENHPETKKWFAKHKRIDKDLWNQGILFCRRTEKHGPVHIELESDPLEILKMGTYVGSCLSLGGSYAYSAVAVLLDLNKQVLYARDQNNKVLGRQLVALSENDELVCFEVYPLTASSRIKNLFFEYDIDFSKALDIDLHEGKFSKHKEYEIKQILSKHWSDDYAWNKIAPDA